jgi:hypothetical protein
MKPTPGRIVFVRSPAFVGEYPAVVVKSYAGVSEQYCDVRVFTASTDTPPYLQAIGPQSESSEKWGWRWPPRLEGDALNRADRSVPENVPHTPALSAQEQLARV